MEKPVAKHLGEENGDAITRQLLQIHPGFAQALDLPHRHAIHALHHQHFGADPVPEHLRHHDQMQIGHVAAQLGGTGGFAHQVQLIVQVLVELGHHLARLEALAVGRQAVYPRGHHADQAHILVDDLQHAGAQHFHRHLALASVLVTQGGEMHLRDGCAGHRLPIEAQENLADRLAERPLDDGDGLLGRKRRHAVLQQRQLIGDVRRQQVAPGGQHLAKLDEDRPQFL